MRKQQLFDDVKSDISGAIKSLSSLVLIISIHRLNGMFSSRIISSAKIADDSKQDKARVIQNLKLLINMLHSTPTMISSFY